MMNSLDQPLVSRQPGARAQIRLGTLALMLLLAGCAVAAFFCFRLAQPPDTVATGSAPAAVVSEATRAVLMQLPAPVELRFYSLLDPAGASDSLKAFAGRVDLLLVAYEQAAGDKLKVVRRTSPSANAAAALADGLKPFNLDKGDACYLGIVALSGTHKELLPQLSPDWEPAVEADLTRAISRLAVPSRPGAASLTAAPPDPKVVEEVKRTVPNFATVSVEEATKILRAAALQEFSATAKELSVQLTAAQQRLSQAQSGGSEAEQQAAMKQLQELQATQTAKLQEIAARTQAQIDALKQLKKSAP